MIPRAVVYGLLLVVLLLPLWWLAQQPPLPAPGAAGPEVLPIALASEVEAPVPLAEVSTERACYVVGPFDSSEAALVFASRHLPDAREQVVREARSREVEAYRVYQQAAGDAGLALMRARSAGFSDAFLLTEGPRAGAVSLGYFEGRENALRRLEQARGAGLPARLQPVLSPQRFFWIDFHYPLAEGPSRIDTDGVTLVHRPCP